VPPACAAPSTATARAATTERGQWFPHWFDGDGLITAVRFDDGGVHFRNRYIATQSFRDEEQAGEIVHRGFGKMRPGGVLGSVVANAFRQPANVANTSIISEGGRLLALWEGGPPTALDPGTLETRGIEDFRGALKAFSAHPRIDPIAASCSISASTTAPRRP